MGDKKEPASPVTVAPQSASAPSSPTGAQAAQRKHKVVLSGNQEGKGYSNENSNKMKTVLLLTYANGKYPADYITKPNDIRKKVGNVTKNLPKIEENFFVPSDLSCTFRLYFSRRLWNSNFVILQAKRNMMYEYI